MVKTKWGTSPICNSSDPQRLAREARGTGVVKIFSPRESTHQIDLKMQCFFSPNTGFTPFTSHFLRLQSLRGGGSDNLWDIGTPL